MALQRVEIKPGIFWVGGVDWDIRDFHGYTTRRGTTYNAYLIIDEKIVLVDTVKHYLYEEMLARIKDIVDPSKIDYIISNHVEMDHSGSLPFMVKAAPNATIITSPNGEKGLKRHFKTDGWRFHVVKTGDTLKIGKRTLAFVQTPMVHWPDSMVTYIPEERLLLPNDAFGQHIADTQRFDDGIAWGILKEEAAKYYGNIVLPYGDQVKKALEALGGLQIDMIAPSHGIIWRSRIPDIIGEYRRWADNDTEETALIVYDTMWGSTEKMAHALKDGIENVGIPVKMRNLKVTHMSDVITDLLTTRLIIIGSPTLNNGMLPSVGGFLTYVKGLRPKRRIGFAFGSYGWGGQSVGEIEKTMTDIGWDMPIKGVKFNWVPDDGELAMLKGVGKELGEYIKGKQ